MKTLESLNRILEQPDEQDGAESSHLAVLEKLHGMTLSTQEIIASKIGVVVSKLRKSRYESVVGCTFLLGCLPVIDASHTVVVVAVDIYLSLFARCSNEKVAKAAILLRKKWKTEAARA